MRIHLLYEHDVNGDPHGCSEIRLLRPLFHPSIVGRLQVSAGPALPREAVDAVVVERMWRPGFGLADAEWLLEEVTTRGAQLIYTLDDNLLDVHRERPWLGGPGAEQRMAIALLAREAVGVMVSTAPLGARMGRLNRRVEVVPNALDERLFPPRAARTATEEGVTIGYMGTFSHRDDLMMVLEPLRAVLRRHRGRVRFQMLGISTDATLHRLFAGLPFEALDNSAFYRYPDFAAWMGSNLHWDLGIAPLEPSPLNYCKSDIKYLDYSLLGIPGLYSEGAAYGESVRHGVTGWRVPEGVQVWEAALEDALADGGVRRGIAAEAEREVRAGRTLKRCATAWVEAIDRLLG